MDFVLQELSLRQHLDGHCIWWPVAGGRWPVGLWLVVAGTNRTCSIDPLINLSLIEFLGGPSQLVGAPTDLLRSFGEAFADFRGGSSGHIYIEMCEYIVCGSYLNTFEPCHGFTMVYMNLQCITVSLTTFSRDIRWPDLCVEFLSSTNPYRTWL